MLITEEELRTRLGADSAAWLTTALAQVREASRPAPDRPAPQAAPAWERYFAAAGRQCGGPDAAEAARVLLLHTAQPTPDEVVRLYQRGTGAERRAVLLALPHLPIAPHEGVPLIEDALRANDTRLIAAAVGPFAAAHLGAHAWRHAVLKCLFTGIPLAEVAGFSDRARGDDELGRMLRDFAAERTAAGRRLPSDLRHALALTSKEP
ncbi:EboA domain-containing protein [Streptomyces sp. NPDC059862]|uniref:EboA domain-containing protein n=1 Tax=unclassified Streptomyces TaxID=2593676 RepID=UPI003627D9B0